MANFTIQTCFQSSFFMALNKNYNHMKNFIDKIRDQFEDQEIIINADDKLMDLEDYDSMTALMIISMMEEEYNVLISADDLDEETTIIDLYNKTL